MLLHQTFSCVELRLSQGSQEGQEASTTVLGEQIDEGGLSFSPSIKRRLKGDIVKIYK